MPLFDTACDVSIKLLQFSLSCCLLVRSFLSSFLRCHSFVLCLCMHAVSGSLHAMQMHGLSPSGSFSSMLSLLAPNPFRSAPGYGARAMAASLEHGNQLPDDHRHGNACFMHARTHARAVVTSIDYLMKKKPILLNRFDSFLSDGWP